MPIEAKETHIQTWKANIDRHALTALIAEHIAKQAGVDLKMVGVTHTVKFEDVTEGSPAYRVGQCAKVEIVRDFNFVPGDEPRV